MYFDPDIFHRRSIRLKHYDYSQGGAYFVTICSFNKEHGAIWQTDFRIITDHNRVFQIRRNQTHQQNPQNPTLAGVATQLLRTNYSQ